MQKHLCFGKSLEQIQFVNGTYLGAYLVYGDVKVEKAGGWWKKTHLHDLLFWTAQKEDSGRVIFPP